MPSKGTVEEVTSQSHEYELVADEQQDLSKWLLACAEMVEMVEPADWTADWPIENV